MSFSSFVWATSFETATLTKQSNILDKPNGKTIGSFPASKKVTVSTEAQMGFRKIKTKSGKGLWISEKDLSFETDLEGDIDTDQEAHPASRFSYDLGLSMGSYGGSSYTEANLGVNYFVLNWLNFRNSLFYRFGSQSNSFYGLDSSLRGIFSSNKGMPFGMTVFAGPGYRIANKGSNAPFVEAGVILKVMGLNLGGGLKSVFYSVAQSGAANDTQYFVILSGGGSL